MLQMRDRQDGSIGRKGSKVTPCEERQHAAEVDGNWPQELSFA